MDRGGREQPPTWVTFVPSRTRPTLVADLAKQAARLLGVPVHPVVQRTRPCARPQAELAKGLQQYRNAHDAFAVTGTLPPWPGAAGRRRPRVRLDAHHRRRATARRRRRPRPFVGPAVGLANPRRRTSRPRG